MSDRFQEAMRLYKAKRYQPALDEFLAMDEDPSENPDLSYYIGLCYTKMDDYDNALLYLEQVVTLHTNLILIYQCRMILSYIYTVTKRFKLAEFELKQLVDNGFESPQVFSIFGYTCYSLADIEQSMEYLHKALRLDPDNANALNSIGYIMAEHNLDIPSAVSYCKKAVKLQPENPSYLDSLGWALFKAGETEDARELLRKAFNLSPGNKTIALHMRDIIQSEEPA